MRPIVNYSLHSADKADIPAEIHKYRFTNFAISTRITVAYTDGSNVKMWTGRVFSVESKWCGTSVKM